MHRQNAGAAVFHGPVVFNSFDDRPLTVGGLSILAQAGPSHPQLIARTDLKRDILEGLRDSKGSAARLERAMGISGDPKVVAGGKKDPREPGSVLQCFGEGS